MTVHGSKLCSSFRFYPEFSLIIETVKFAVKKTLELNLMVFKPEGLACQKFEIELGFA